MNQRLSILFVCLIPLAGIEFGAGCGQKEPQTNVLLITLDTLRTDRLGCYGYDAAETPALDALSEAGVTFDRAYTPVPFTLPAHASILTGMYPPEHGLRVNGENALGADAPLITEVFAAAGYRTGAFLAAFVLNRKFGLDRGFAIYDDSQAGAEHTGNQLHSYRNGHLVIEAALEWLDNPSTEPFFAWVHLYDAHTPYHAHRDRFGDRFLDRPYDAELAFVDAQIGRLLSFLDERGLAARTLVVVVGDHGEGLGDHGEETHGYMTYNTTMRVPLIARLPDAIPAGLRVDDPVSLIRIAPTLAELAGVPSPWTGGGRSLAAAMRGDERAPAIECYGESDAPFVEHGWSPIRTVITDRWKYMRTSIPELYDLSADPEETRNLERELPEQALLMDDLLASLEERMRTSEAATAHLSSQERRVLESLGYTAGGSREEVDPMSVDLPDMKDKIHLVNQSEEARDLIAAGEAEKGLALLRRVTEQEPDDVLFLRKFGVALVGQAQYVEAAGVWRRILEHRPGDSAILNRLGVAYYHLGKFSEAQAAYESSIAADASFSTPHNNLLVLFLNQGQPDRALEHGLAALKITPELAEAHRNVAMVYMGLGKTADAHRHWVEALRIEPSEQEYLVMKQRVEKMLDAPSSESTYSASPEE